MARLWYRQRETESPGGADTDGRGVGPPDFALDLEIHSAPQHVFGRERTHCQRFCSLSADLVCRSLIVPLVSDRASGELKDILRLTEGGDPAVPARPGAARAAHN